MLAAGIGYTNAADISILEQLEAERLDGKIRIAQPIAEGIKHAFRCEGFEKAVADEDVLGVIVVNFAEEIVSAWVILIAVGNRVSEPAAGIYDAREHVSQGIAALHSALPGIDHSLDAILVASKPGQVDNIAAIKNNYSTGKSRGHLIEQFLFVSCEVEAAGLEHIFAILAGRAANNDDGFVISGGSLSDHILTDRHFLEIAGPVCPEAFKRRIGITPFPVYLDQLTVELYVAVLLQPIDQTNCIGRINITAGAIAYVHVVMLNTAEDSDFFIPCQRQTVIVVFKQNQAFGSCVTASGGQNWINVPAAADSFVTSLR